MDSPSARGASSRSTCRCVIVAGVALVSSTLAARSLLARFRRPTGLVAPF